MCFDWSSVQWREREEEEEERKRIYIAPLLKGSGTLGILPFMAKWTLCILDGGGWGVGGLATFCGRDYIAVACYVQQWIT